MFCNSTSLGTVHISDTLSIASWGLALPGMRAIIHLSVLCGFWKVKFWWTATIVDFSTGKDEIEARLFQIYGEYGGKANVYALLFRPERFSLNGEVPFRRNNCDDAGTYLGATLYS